MKNLKIFLGLGIVLLAGFAIQPWRAEVNEMKAQTEQLQTQRETAQIRFTQLQEAEQISEENPEELLVKVPRTQEQEQVIRDITRIAERTGFDISQMTFSKRTDKTLKGGVLTTNVVLEGPKKSLELFLLGTEQNERFLSVESLNVKVIDAETSSKATVSLSIQSYYQTS